MRHTGEESGESLKSLRWDAATLRKASKRNPFMSYLISIHIIDECRPPEQTIMRETLFRCDHLNFFNYCDLQLATLNHNSLLVGFGI